MFLSMSAVAVNTGVVFIPCVIFPPQSSLDHSQVVLSPGRDRVFPAQRLARNGKRSSSERFRLGEERGRFRIRDFVVAPEEEGACHIVQSRRHLTTDDSEHLSQALLTKPACSGRHVNRASKTTNGVVTNADYGVLCKSQLMAARLPLRLGCLVRCTWKYLGVVSSDCLLQNGECLTVQRDRVGHVERAWEPRSQVLGIFLRHLG